MGHYMKLMFLYYALYGTNLQTKVLSTILMFYKENCAMES